MRHIDQFRQQLIDFEAETGVKPYKLAREAKLHPSTVYRIIKGERHGMMMGTYDKLNEVMTKHLENQEVWTPNPETKEVNHVEVEAASTAGG